MRYWKVAEDGNKPSCGAGKLYLLQSLLELGRFRREICKCTHCANTNDHNFKNTKIVREFLHIFANERLFFSDA